MINEEMYDMYLLEVIDNTIEEYHPNISNEIKTDMKRLIDQFATTINVLSIKASLGNDELRKEFIKISIKIVIKYYLKPEVWKDLIMSEAEKLKKKYF